MALRVRRSLIKPLLRQHRKKQADLAKYLGVTQGYVSQLANGQSDLTYEMGANVAAFFGVPMDKIVEWYED